MAEHSLPEPTTTAPADDIHLTTYSRFKTGFTKLDVEHTGRYAGLANNKGVLVYDLEEQDKRHNFSLFQGRGLVGAIKWNPHYNRRMHIASALGQEVIVWDMAVKVPHSAETKHRDTSEVVDICWSPFEENMIVSAGFSHSMLLWDTRAQKPVREFNVGTDTTQVSFNRRNIHILASASGGQVWVWDTRKVKKPLAKINATDRGTAVTSLDWSYENQYDLLTSGGGDLSVKLWSVAMAIPEQRTSYINIAADQRTLEQPVKRVLFVPVTQAAITTSRGELEARHELQTIKMWSLDPARRFQLVNTFAAGSQRIIGVCFRTLGVEAPQYQVASLDSANHLRLHDIEGPKQSGTGIDLPAGSSSTWRESASTAGSESLEGAATSSAFALKDDLIPPVWSKLANAASSTMAAETMRITGSNAMREIMEVQRAARLGTFDHVSDIRLYPTQKCATLVMVASAEAKADRLSSAQDTPQQRQSGREPGITDAPIACAGGANRKCVARLRITVKAPPEYTSRDEPPIVRLESTGGSVPAKPPRADGAASDAPNLFGSGSSNMPLDEDTLKRLQIVADDAMRQAPKSRQSRLEACLLRLRRELNDRVRNVVQHAAGLATRKEDPSPPIDHQSGLQFVLDETRVVPVTSEPTAGAKLSDPSALAKLPTLAPGLSAVSGMSSLSALSAISAGSEPIVPCPRRFGATFSPGGTLVVFSSSLAVILARPPRPDDTRKHRTRDNSQGSAASAYPRTFASFLQCLKKIRTFDIADETHDDDLQLQHYLQQQQQQQQQAAGTDENRNWLRPWGPVQAPSPDMMEDTTCGDDDDHDPTLKANAWENQGNDPYDMEPYCTESEHSSGVEESETLIPYNYGDSTRLPISHPDHSLGPGLGPPSSDTDTDTDNDAIEKDGCNHHDKDGGNHTDVIIKGQVPWTPKPKQVMLVDCSRFLPGSRELAASYKLGGRSDAWRTRDSQRQQGTNLFYQTALSSLYSLGRGHDAHENMLSRFPVGMDSHPASYGSQDTRRELVITKTHQAAATPRQDGTAGCGGNVEQGNAQWYGPDTQPQSFLAGGSHHQVWGNWDAAKLPLGEQGFSNIRRPPRPRMSIMTSMLKEAPSVSPLLRGTYYSKGSGEPSQQPRKTTTSESSPATEVGTAEEYCANLCRYNAAVATGCGYPEQATFWALLAVASDKEACAQRNAPSGRLVGARWHAGWKGTASRSIEKVLRHFEIVGDPQTLASMVCVLASASKDGGYGTLLPGGPDNVSKYDRYLTSYAEQLYQWSAHGVRTEIISHVRGGENQPSPNDTATVAPVCQGVKEEGRLRCSLCGKLVGLAAPKCMLCGHGGHAMHMKSWFADESECPQDGCKCYCWMEVEGV